MSSMYPLEPLVSSLLPKKSYLPDIFVLGIGGPLMVLVMISRVFLQHQLWTVNYYIKRFSNNLTNGNINTGFFREIVLKK